VQNPKDNLTVFSTTVWDKAHPDVKTFLNGISVSQQHHHLAHRLERVSMFYLRNLDRSIPPNHPSRSIGPLCHLFGFASHSIHVAESGKWSFWNQEWNCDSYEQITAACEPYAGFIDTKILQVIGDNMISIATGSKHAIEVGMKDNMLAEYYQHSLGMGPYTGFFARSVK